MSIKSEAYVHLSEDQTTLTFYYDAFRADRDGTTWGIEEKKKNWNSSSPAWTGDGESPDITVLTAVFDASFRDFCPTTTAEWFYCLNSLKSIEGFEHLNTSQVTSMRDMFSGCSSLTSLDLSSFDTSKVRSMRHMFSGCSSLTILNLISFDTSKVGYMSSMFSGCSSLTSLDLSSFDTSRVTCMRGMFFGCSSLTALDLSRFDTSAMMDMSNMFRGCSSLTTLDLSRVNTFFLVKVKDMSNMFRGCSSLTTIYSNSSWSCIYSNDMFSGCNSLRGAETNVGKSFDVSMANPERGYFTKKVLSQENEAYVHLSVDKKTLTFYFDRERNVRMRCYAWGIETTIRPNDQGTPEWLSSEVVSKEEITQIIIDESFRNVVPKTTASWFEGLSAVTEIRGLDNLNTSEVDDMSGMFAGCSALRTLDVSRFDTSQVTDMSGMFRGCKSLAELDLYFFDTAKVRDISEMFSGCSSLTTLDLSSFDTSKVMNMGGMFCGCWLLTTLDLSSFDTFQVTDMSNMFRGCSSLITIYSNSSWSCRYSNDMFSGCNSLRGAETNVGKSFDVSMANPERGYFTKKVLSQENEAYVHLSVDKKTLTFYFDRERNVRMRCYAWGIETTIRPNDQGTPEWLSSEVVSKEEITQIIIDESFRNVVPKTTASWFEGLSAVTEIRGLDNLNTSEVTDMSGMFRGCSSLTTLDLSRFDTSQVTDMHTMFKNCKSLTTLDLSNFQTSEVKNMGEMFSGCSTLTTILSFAFRNCFASEAMFYECSSLQGATNFNEKYTDARMANPERGYFTKKEL